jgi:thiol-disulfide isomerase/thioredoxin
MVGTSWCPHCTKAKPEFEALGPTVTTAGGKTVATKYLDGEKEKAAIPPGLKVDGYPTIALIKSDGSVVKHTGPRTKAALHQFVEQNA